MRSLSSFVGWVKCNGTQQWVYDGSEFFFPFFLGLRGTMVSGSNWTDRRLLPLLL
ncbi:hypothetical protein NIES39_C05150 [Arthrospira platensis NIES-39]|nr:hypothetical protein NIES39_C05150 [Arthrospira platensis NIES-39]